MRTHIYTAIIALINKAVMYIYTTDLLYFKRPAYSVKAGCPSAVINEAGEPEGTDGFHARLARLNDHRDYYSTSSQSLARRVTRILDDKSDWFRTVGFRWCCIRTRVKLVFLKKKKLRNRRIISIKVWCDVSVIDTYTVTFVSRRSYYKYTECGDKSRETYSHILIERGWSASREKKTFLIYAVHMSPFDRPSKANISRNIRQNLHV